MPTPKRAIPLKKQEKKKLMSKVTKSSASTTSKAGDRKGSVTQKKWQLMIHRPKP